MDFEKLFISSIYALIEFNGGSLEQAMDDMGLRNKETRKQITEYLEWDEEDEEDEDDDFECDLSL